MNNLTKIQRNALESIEIHISVRNRDLIKRNPDCTPSMWITIHNLTYIHKMSSRTIRALIRKGFLEEQPSGGFGPKVRIIEKMIDGVTPVQPEQPADPVRVLKTAVRKALENAVADGVEPDAVEAAILDVIETGGF